MRKRWLFVGLAASLALTVGGVAFAETSGGTFNFQQMLPYAKQMHPNWSNQQIRDMLNECQTYDNNQGKSGSGWNMMGGNSGYGGNRMGGYSAPSSNS